jgi:hypothetical protein
MKPENIMATSLVLRTCRADLTSRNGFQWAGVGGITTAPDWKNNTECGNGLHGWLYGAGDHSCSDYLDAESVWMVLEVVTSDVIMLGGKCKFPSAKTVFIGDRKGASEYMLANEPRSANVEIIGRIAEVGDKQSLIGGALSTLTGGEGSTLTGGEGSTLTGGYRSTLTGGNYSTLTGGDRSTLTGGDRSTLTGGDRSELRIRYWDGKANRYRTVIAYVGEDGIKSGTPYRLCENNKFMEVRS